MDTASILNLLRPAIQPGPAVWADFGSGTGAFTLALRELAGSSIEIYSVDRNESSLQKQEQTFAKEFPGTNLHLIPADFTVDLDLPPLDGILMANALHFVKDKAVFLEKLQQHLKPKGKLLIVEYDTESSNEYVPYPMSFETLQRFLPEHGFQPPTLVGTAPSKYEGQMYSAVTKLRQ